MNLSAIDIFFSIVVILLFLLSLILTLSIKALGTAHPAEAGPEAVDLAELRTYRKGTSLIFLSILVIFGTYHYSIANGLQAHVLDWINLIFRWAHIVLGIAWIGASFYFIFLENSLNRTTNLREEVAGNLWAIHGGGFYYVEKFKSAPPALPAHLHWFKYEAYFTWLTGFLLLILVYFMNAKAVMIDPSVSSISESAAIAIGIIAILSSWVTYDFLCATRLLYNTKLFGITGFAITLIYAYVLSQFLSGRAAFMLTGAMLGSIMAGNVFFCIIPSQKALVRAAQLKLPVNPAIGKVAGLRSLHNNYITLPVIFTMISHHFPVTYGPSHNWMILAILMIASIAVRHYHNSYEKGIRIKWLLPSATLLLVLLIFGTAPEKSIHGKDLPPVPFAQVQTVIQKHCTSCHSANPVDEVYISAPNGIAFDTPQQIAAYGDRIIVRAVQTRTMPQGNKSGMTDEERELLRIWIEQGSRY